MRCRKRLLYPLATIETEIGLSLLLLMTLGLPHPVREWIRPADSEPPRDEDGNLLPDEHANKPVVLAYLNRAWDSVRKLNTSIIEPHNEMLLGPPLESPYHQPPYTLVLEMTDILIHPEWTFDAGWRFKKRPGLEYFLQKANFPNFEVVIYTKESYNATCMKQTAMPLVQYLSSLSALSGFISRENTHYIKGTHVKTSCFRANPDVPLQDLSRLNRDLSKVIYIDWNSKASHLQPDNLLRIPRWNGDDRDATLVDLADMLTIHVVQVMIIMLCLVLPWLPHKRRSRPLLHRGAHCSAGASPALSLALHCGRRLETPKHESCLKMLIPLVSMHDGDIRPTLQYYSQFDNPLSVYKENKRKLRRVVTACTRVVTACTRVVTACTRVVTACTRVVTACTRVVTACTRVVTACTRVVTTCTRVVTACTRVVTACTRVVTACTRVVTACTRVVTACTRVVTACTRVVTACTYQTMITWSKRKPRYKICIRLPSATYGGQAYSQDKGSEVALVSFTLSSSSS
ncbi:TIMM50 [Cordylochernes scorpioides]|uniref:Mitochondrial import inner membrane translocase subunit TIM50 n=1 Tax=Cordylochernes scorpioides TaxID=51811 RepID=A0ABY6L3T1_9ARAC|nr:TIMM50 [Cordylochernes scorpioides]